MLEKLLKEVGKKDKMNQEDVVYPLDKILSAATKVIEIDEGSGSCWLCLYQKEEYEHWLDYGLFQIVSSASDGSSTEVSCIFQGGGTGTLKEGEFSLREFRHTYFGDDGYVFYMPIKETIKALQILSTYFD